MAIAGEFRTSAISLRNILFAMDFSPGSLRAYPFAVTIAQHFGSKIYATHIIPPENADGLPLAERTTLDKLLYTAVEAGLVEPGSDLPPVPHEVLIDHGRIISRLIAAADRNHIDLIVMGTHGWRGLEKLIHGSTAEEIASVATKPVLTIGPNASPRHTFKRILYATDFLPASVHALPWATNIAASYHAELVILHVNDGDNPESPVEATPQTFAFLSRYMGAYTMADKPAKPEVIVDFGPRADAIVKRAQSRNADLIILGLRPVNSIRAWIAAHVSGTLLHEVISRASCPVLAVPLSRRTAADVQYVGIAGRLRQRVGLASRV